MPVVCYGWRRAHVPCLALLHTSTKVNSYTLHRKRETCTTLVPGFHVTVGNAAHKATAPQWCADVTQIHNAAKWRPVGLWHPCKARSHNPEAAAAY